MFPFRQVSRSPHSKHSKRRHSPYSSLETTRYFAIFFQLIDFCSFYDNCRSMDLSICNSGETNFISIIIMRSTCISVWINWLAISGEKDQHRDQGRDHLYIGSDCRKKWMQWNNWNSEQTYLIETVICEIRTFQRLVSNPKGQEMGMTGRWWS